MLLSELVMFSPNVELVSLPHAGLVSDTVWLKLIWQSPGVASRADLVVMMGMMAMVMREMRRIMVLTRVDLLSRARSYEAIGLKTEGARKEVNRDTI